LHLTPSGARTRFHQILGHIAHHVAKLQRFNQLFAVGHNDQGAAGKTDGRGQWGVLKARSPAELLSARA